MQPAGKSRSFAAAIVDPQRRRLTRTVDRLRLRGADATGTMTNPMRLRWRAAEGLTVKVVFIIDRRQDWPFELPGSRVVTAR